MEKVRNGLTNTIRYFYGVGDMAFALMTSVGTYYSTYYFTNIAKLSLVNVALLTSTVALIDALTAWIYGAIINSTKPMKWGRYRSWLVAFTWIIPILYFFQYFKVSEAEPIATAFFFVFHLGSRFAHNFPYIANATMISVAAKTPDERATMASSRATWNNASKFAWSYLGVPFLAILIGLFGERLGYAVLSGLLALLMVITYWIHFKMFEGFEESSEAEKTNEAKAKRARTGVKDLVKAIAQNPPLLVLLIADLGKWVFNFVIAGTVVYYFKYIALNPGAQAYYSLIIAFCAVIGSFLSRIIAKKISSKTTMVVFYLIMAACLFAARMCFEQMWPVIILISVAQLGYGCCYSCSSALYADTVVYNEWKTGKNASGWIMGLQNIPLKIGGTLRSVIVTACLAVGGFSATIDPAATTMEMKSAICLALMVVPGIVLVACAFIILFGFRLSKARVEEMQKEIDEKKAKEDSQAAAA
ncbi:MAG: MFS transporter [Lachnospiraceae bacterium]|jgi:GPH family glycoside/pentoside/hexuronide:cation symporter|nr:MFS transporter [Lachnospiraceae bacterium]